MTKILCSLYFLIFPTILLAIDLTPTNEKFKVGVIAPLTGGVAVWGKSVRTAIEIANLESKTPAELFFQDEETCSPAKALSAYQYLVYVEKVQMLVASCLEGAQAIAPLAKKDNIPFFISGRSSADFQAKNPNALSWLSLLDYEGLAISKLVAKNKWKKGVALVWDGYFGVQFAAAIKNAIDKEPLDFDFKSVELSTNAVPNATEVQALLRTKPEVVFVMTSEPTAVFFIRQLRSFGYQGSIIIQSSMLQTYDLKGRKAFLGSIQQKFPVNQQRFTEIQTKIKKLLGEDVADDFVFSYDGFSMLLTEASICQSEKAMDLERCLNTKIRNEAWREGASGKFKIMPDGSTERPMIFKEVTEHGFQNID